MDQIFFYKKMTSASAEQIKMLLRFMQEHPDLSNNRLLRNSEGRHRARGLWLDLTKQLNAVGRSVKTVAQWQKVWTDRKYMAKKAAFASRRSDLSTEAGQAGTSLSEEHEIIRKILISSCETPTKDEEDPLLNPKSEERLTIYCQLSDEEKPSELHTEDNTNNSTPITEEKPKRITATNPARNQRRRYVYRRNNPQPDFCGLLQELEEQKRTELTLIRQSIGDLNNTLKDLVQEFRHIREKL